jgi:hypothetical protein
LNEKFPDGPSRRHLQKESVDNIRSGKCEEWDISLLCSLLLYKPGLKRERNLLSHVLMVDLLPAEKESHRSKIKEISTEQHMQDLVE